MAARYPTQLTHSQKRLRQRFQGMSNEELYQVDSKVLDEAAFGFSSEDLLEVPLSFVHIRYPGDLQEAKSRVPSSARGWEGALRKPVEITLRKGRLELEDGHHRYIAARRLGRKTILAQVTISDNPILKIRGRRASVLRVAKLAAIQRGKLKRRA